VPSRRSSEPTPSLRRCRPRPAARAQERRLGVRLAQRLVSAAHADEVNARIERWREGYDERLGRVA
jgi:hypothetical protein